MYYFNPVFRGVRGTRYLVFCVMVKIIVLAILRQFDSCIYDFDIAAETQLYIRCR